MHKFYQEQYQLNGGSRTATSPAATRSACRWATTTRKQLPIYRYLHRKRAPHYVIADHFFQAAFGGSYLNHQYLVAAQPPLWTAAPANEHSVIDSAGMPRNNYPLYTHDVPGAGQDG